MNANKRESGKKISNLKFESLVPDSCSFAADLSIGSYLYVIRMESI